MPNLLLPHRVTPVRRIRLLLGAAIFIAAATTTACDRIKSQLTAESQKPAPSDPGWIADSTFLAQNPSIIFRLVPLGKGRGAVPVASYGASGFRQLKMSVRGWKALDVNFLHNGNTLTAIHDGHATGEIKMVRGEWEMGSPLDSLPGCPALVPAGLTDGGASTSLAVVGARPTIAAAPQIPPDELANALEKIPMLIAPAQGISRAMISRYSREVHLIPGGGPRTSILVIYNDPEQVSDTLRDVAQRPRQLILILDKGNFGYRPSYARKTLGNVMSLPRLTYLDYLDVDSDGKAELFFGFEFRAGKLTLPGTQVLRYENDAWRDVLRDGLRCQS